MAMFPMMFYWNYGSRRYESMLRIQTLDRQNYQMPPNVLPNVFAGDLGTGLGPMWYLKKKRLAAF